MAANYSSLTAKQKKVYMVIEYYIKTNGIPPTVREIGNWSVKRPREPYRDT